MDNNCRNLIKITSISRTECCQECIGRVYNKNTYIYYGVGNTNANTMFIIPPHEINKLTPVEEELFYLFGELFNKDLYKDCYVTRSVKCPIKDNDKIETAFNNCKHNLYNEIYIVAPRRIIIIGKSNSFIKDIFDKIFVGIQIIVVPSPLTKTINSSAYNELKEQLKKYVLL